MNLNKGASNIECLDEDIDDYGFIEGDVTTGNVLSTFSFGMCEALINNEAPSTVRKRNMLKAEHPDVNMLFNTIIDMDIMRCSDYCEKCY